MNLPAAIAGKPGCLAYGKDCHLNYTANFVKNLLSSKFRS